MNLLNSISFSSPYALWAISVLPGIWFILKMYPPSPKNITFPPILFLKNLTQKEETSSATPIWLLIFRSLIVLLIIFAFANPVYNKSSELNNDGPLLLILDDGWPSSINWEKRKQKALEYIEKSDQKNLPIILISSTETDQVDDEIILMSSNDAKAKLDTMNPNPWPSDISFLRNTLKKVSKEKKYNIVWIWDGINHDKQENYQRIISELSNLGDLEIINYLNDFSTKIISKVKNTGDSDLHVELERSLGTIEEKIFIRILGLNGEIISRKEVLFPRGERISKIDIQIPSQIRNKISYLEVENLNNAGSIYLLDEKWKKRNIGIFGDKYLFKSQPLLSPIYYLDRALKPFSNSIIDNLKNIVSEEISVIFLPDVGKINEELTNSLNKWISSGGILVRFAGPNLIETNDNLLPVKLRASSSRNLGGVLSWEQPAKIKKFLDSSPFNNIEINRDILISKQVIADPNSIRLSETWASLEDGTPLISAKKIDKGWNILFHVTANADWSNLPLSGTFVEILERIVNLSFLSQDLLIEESLAPYSLLDGFGRLSEPYPFSSVLNFASKNISINYSNSPGFYGNELYRMAVNLGEHINPLEPLVVTFPENVEYQKSTPDKSIYLKFWLIILAIFLLLIDSLLSLTLRGKINFNTKNSILKSTMILVIILFSFPINNIQANEEILSLTPSLGYIQTNNEEIDIISAAGLSTLGKVLEQRTSIILGPPKRIIIEEDNISFFPFIYWPIYEGSKSISQQTVSKLQNYIENGGLLLFDTRDANPSKTIGNEISTEQKLLKQILGPLDLPALIPIPKDHVLRRSFYLLNEFPGRWSGEDVWVEVTAENSRDGVSSIIIGRNDWASAWAKIDNKPQYVVVPGGEKQREYSYRFGVNIVMYAMTGNYKSDQVHIKSILRRLQNLNLTEEGRD